MFCESQYECHSGEFPSGSHGINTQGDSVSGVGGRYQLAKGEFEDVFPCADPTNPLYADYSNRLQSYQAWPGHIKDPSPVQLATAGLFFLGDRDRCKCYYCNGGLQNWETGDDPMVEHAKYFPQCEFVLQNKGPDFVAELNARFPNLKRPGIVSSTSQVQQTMNFHQSARNNAAIQDPGYQTACSNSSGQFVVDAIPINFSSNGPARHVINNMRNQQSQLNSHEHELILRAQEFGFDKNMTEKVIVGRRRQSKPPFDNLGDLVDELLTSAGNMSDDEENMDVCGIAMPSSLPREIVADDVHHPDLMSQFQSALDETICKECHERERSCVFMDCGHLCCCYECGQNVKHCPICKGNVLQTIRIYKT